MNEPVAVCCGFPVTTFTEAGIDPASVSPDIVNMARKVVDKLVDPQSKQFSLMLIIAVIGLIVEGIKMYRDCKKKPEEIQSELMNGIPIWRPLRRLAARRLMRKYLKDENVRKELGDEAPLDAVGEVIGGMSLQLIHAIMGVPFRQDTDPGK